MFLMRIVVQGRLSELLVSDDSTLAVDTFMRKNGFYAKALENHQHLGSKTKQILDEYSQGINAYLQVNSNQLSHFSW